MQAVDVLDIDKIDGVIEERIIGAGGHSRDGCSLNIGPRAAFAASSQEAT